MEKELCIWVTRGHASQVCREQKTKQIVPSVSLVSLITSVWKRVIWAVFSSPSPLQRNNDCSYPRLVLTMTYLLYASSLPRNSPLKVLHKTLQCDFTNARHYAEVLWFPPTRHDGLPSLNCPCGRVCGRECCVPASHSVFLSYTEDPCGL